MFELRPYGVGALCSTRLVDGAGSPPGVTFASPTLVAGDVKRSSDQLALGNLTAEFVAFTSGSEEPTVGDTLNNNSQTAVYIGSKLTSGSWSGGDAAGYMFLEQVSGVLAAGTTGISGGTADVCTFSADATDLIGAIAISGEIWFALTSTEMACKQVNIYFADQGATVWADDGYKILTVGGSGLHADVIGNLDDAAAAGVVTSTDSMMAYMKQVIQLLRGTDTDLVSTIKTMYGVISDSVNDASATATGFTVTTDVSTDVRVGTLRFTSGALAGESRLVSWTGTTITVLSDSSMPTALKQFSAAPANSVTFDFWPLR